MRTGLLIWKRWEEIKINLWLWLIKLFLTRRTQHRSTTNLKPSSSSRFTTHSNWIFFSLMFLTLLLDRSKLIIFEVFLLFDFNLFAFEMSSDKHPQDVLIDQIIDRIMKRKLGDDWNESHCLSHNSQFDKTLRKFYQPPPKHNISLRNYKDELKSHI